MKRKLSLLMVVALSATLLFGCGTTPTNDGSDKGDKAGLKKATGMVTDIGGVNDESFNQSAWSGMTALQAKGYDAKYLESKVDADYKPNLEKMVDMDRTLIWGVGFMMQTAVAEAAKANKDQLYALVDCAWADGEVPNAIGVMFHSEESSFLVGYIASYVSKTNKVGMIIGMESPVMVRFKYGFEAGVYYGAKEQGKTMEVMYENIQTFGDTAKGKAVAQKMYAGGADIVYHAAGGAGNGVIEAAKELNKFVIGVDLDQNKLAPKNVLTSALKNVGLAVEQITEKVVAGEKLGGTSVYLGLKEGGVGFTTTGDLVPAEVVTKTKAIEKKIIAGEIKVPITEDEFKSFKK